MNFKCYMEEEGSLGAQMPEMSPPMVNKGSGTPASDEVKRTNLQPQVDAQEIDTKSRKEQDRILAIDSDIEHMDISLPDGDDADTPKVNKFKQMWDKLKDEWDHVKMSDDNDIETPEEGLGDGDDEKFRDMMQQHPNMVPVSGDQQHGGPGMFGQS